MAWIATDKCGDCYVYENKPQRLNNEQWDGIANMILISASSTKGFTGKVLTWEDEPVEI